MNSLEARFAEEYNLSPDQVKSLCDAANKAAKAQERVHNESGTAEAMLAAAADARINEFETFAIKCGFTGVDWPGLYPNVRTATRKWIALPLD